MLDFDIANYFDLTCDKKYTYFCFCVKALGLLIHPIALCMFYDDNIFAAQLICTMYCGTYLHTLFINLLRNDIFTGDLFSQFL